MTFPKLGKNEDLMNRSNFGFAGVLFAFSLDREKCAFSKIAFQVRSKVHFVRLIFRSRGKFTLGVLEPVQIFFSVFFCVRNPFQKNSAARLDQGPAAGQPRPGHRVRRAWRRREPPPPRILVGLGLPFFRIPFPTLFLA